MARGEVLTSQTSQGVTRNRSLGVNIGTTGTGRGTDTQLALAQVDSTKTSFTDELLSQSPLPPPSPQDIIYLGNPQKLEDFPGDPEVNLPLTEGENIQGSDPNPNPDPNPDPNRSRSFSSPEADKYIIDIKSLPSSANTERPFPISTSENSREPKPQPSDLTSEQKAIDTAFEQKSDWNKYNDPSELQTLHELLKKDPRAVEAHEILHTLLMNDCITQRVYDRLAGKIRSPISFDPKDPLCWIHPQQALDLIKNIRNQITTGDLADLTSQQKAQVMVRFAVIAEDGGLHALPRVFALSDILLWNTNWSLLLAVKQLEINNKNESYQNSLDRLYKEQLSNLNANYEGLSQGGSLLFLTNYKGRITSGFGPRIHPTLGYRRHHAGIDIAAPPGTPVSSADGGTVKFAGQMGGYGNTVIIDHGQGITTLYAHLAMINVQPGQQVERDTKIGTVGSTGVSTGPHLHFEVREKGNAVNPLKYYRS